MSGAAGPDPYLDHLRAFHRYILGDVYPWAGELRTVSIAKGSLFCLPQHLESYGAEIFGRLAGADRLRGLAREPFIGQLAGESLADVNALHPFREGNGRARRVFFSQLAHDAGHHIDWVRMDPARNVTASAAAHRGDLAPLTAMLDDLIDLPHPIQRAQPRASDPRHQASPSHAQPVSLQLDVTWGHAGHRRAIREARLTSEGSLLRTQLRPHV